MAAMTVFTSRVGMRSSAVGLGFAVVVAVGFVVVIVGKDEECFSSTGGEVGQLDNPSNMAVVACMI